MKAIDPTTEHLRSKYLQVTGFDTFDERRDLFLWVKIYQEEISRLEMNPRSQIPRPTILNQSSIKKISREMTLFPTKVQLLEDICYKLERCPAIKDQLTTLTPSQEIDWITNNTRQLSFIRKLIQLKANNFFQAEDILAGLSNDQLAIISIDLLDMSPNNKVALTRNLKNQWRLFSQPNKGLTWFKADLEKKLSALNYHLQKSGSRKLLRHHPICDFKHIEIFYDSLLLDNESHTFQELQEKTRRRYQKQKYDEQHSDKKQYNIMLPTELIKKLDRKSTQRNIKRSQLIFEILNESTNS
jgi:hypothetical protein